MTSAVKPIETQLGLAWNWQYDADFIRALDTVCHREGVSSYIVSHHNLHQVRQEVERDGRRFLWFLDRASDEDKHFLELNQILQSRGTFFLNSHRHYLRASDKAEIHRELLQQGVHVPLTFVLPPHDLQPHLNPSVVEAFAKPFVVKPARGSGGRGVLTNVTKLEEVTQTRMKQRDQRFLIQQKIEPLMLKERRAWFRVYYVCGQVISCWWCDKTHRYEMLTNEDLQIVNSKELERIVRVIARLTELDFFSCEVALDRTGRYVVVDYVNTPCDMRLQSKYANAVPDIIVQQIIEIITTYVRQQLTTRINPLLPL